jgi:hypothetical protein
VLEKNGYPRVVFLKICEADRRTDKSVIVKHGVEKGLGGGLTEKRRKRCCKYHENNFRNIGFAKLVIDDLSA